MDSASTLKAIEGMTPSNVLEYFIICITLIIGFWIWMNRSSKQKWDGKKERREHSCTEMQNIYKAKERLSVLETKESERNLELQELKKDVEKRFDKIESRIEAGFNKIDFNIGKIFDRIEAVKK